MRWTLIPLLAAIAAVSVPLGLRLRHQQWDRTQTIRYEGDVEHGFGWGQIGNRVGALNVYDLYVSGRFRTIPNELDYTPLRLAIVTAWAHWAESRFPNTRYWQNDYELTSFMLNINSAAELISAILVLLLIYHWTTRGTKESAEVRPYPSVGALLLGLIGFLLFWFNPAVIWDGHCFPQWDSWNMPFFLGAALLASLNWWFAAGCCIAIGAFFKGQILLVAPVFLIWPLFQLRFEAILKIIAGFALAAAVVALPWLHASPAAFTWYLLVLVSMALLAPIVLRWDLPPRWIAILAAASVVLAWPWWGSAAPFWPAEPAYRTKAIAFGILAIAGLARILPLRLAPHMYALAIAAAVFFMIPLFDASSAWYTQGFEFGTVKQMHMGRAGTNSLPTLLVHSFGWWSDPRLLIHVPLREKPVEFRSFTHIIYFACLVLASIGAAIQARRNDSRFLVAITAPWLFWFILLPQMNNRYLVWAAGFSALLPAVGLGMTLLGMLVTAIGWIGIAEIMCEDGGNPELARLITPLCPYLTWALLLAAAIYLYVAIAPRRSFRQSTFRPAP